MAAVNNRRRRRKKNFYLRIHLYRVEFSLKYVFFAERVEECVELRVASGKDILLTN
jgi:hypothetical protein